MNPVTFANPVRMKQTQTASYRVVSLTTLPTEVNTCCLARAAQVLQAPVQAMRPREQFGCIVTVAIDPLPLPKRVILDPVLPLPLVEMPWPFWDDYAIYVGYLMSFFEAHNDYWRRRCMDKARSIFSDLVRGAASVLHPDELGYFKARLLAAWAGDIAGNVQ